MPTSDQSLGLGGMKCSDWPGWDHVSILGPGRWSLPAAVHVDREWSASTYGEGQDAGATRGPEGWQYCQPR